MVSFAGSMQRGDQVSRWTALASVALAVGCSDSRHGPEPAALSAIPLASSSTIVAASSTPETAVVPPPSTSAAPRSEVDDSRCVDLVPGRVPKDGDASAAPQSHPPKRLEGSARGFDTSTAAPFRTLRDAGFGFAMVQAAIGAHPNDVFAKNWATAKSCGFPRGAYQMISDTADGRALTKTLFDVVGNDAGELPITLDLEKPPQCEDDCCHQSCTEWNHRAQDWLDAVETRTHRPAMLYVVEPFFAQCMCASTKWSSRPLWLAAWPRYDFPPKPRLGGFDAWMFYQYQGNVIRYGGAIDLSLFRGDDADFASWVRSASLTPAPP